MQHLQHSDIRANILQWKESFNPLSVKAAVCVKN
jgi:hypothetical protein